MSRHRESPPAPTKPTAYRRAFQRLDEALGKNTQPDNSEKIRLLRQAYFADVDELQKSGTAVLPD